MHAVLTHVNKREDPGELILLCKYEENMKKSECTGRQRSPPLTNNCMIVHTWPSFQKQLYSGTTLAGRT